MKTTLRLLVLLALVTVLAGCAHESRTDARYLAIVEQVEAADLLPRQQYSVEKGPEPVSRIHLRLIRPGRTERLVLLVFGLGDLDALGRPRDHVSFRFPGPLPATGELRFEELQEYRVITGRTTKV